MEILIRKTLSALKENQFDAYYAENSLEALELVKSLIKEGDKVDILCATLFFIRLISPCTFFQPYYCTLFFKRKQLIFTEITKNNRIN